MVGDRVPCWRCKEWFVTVCYMADARDNAEFLGMCQPCYEDWLSQFPKAPARESA